jgi:hypothetical protein
MVLLITFPKLLISQKFSTNDFNKYHPNVEIVWYIIQKGIIMEIMLSP